MLRDKTWRIRYTPDDGDLVRLFYIPALQDAVRYHRLTGYFNAGALALAARGIKGLVRNSGQARLLVGRTLEAEEIAAIERGEALREQVEQRLARLPLMPPDAEVRPLGDREHGLRMAGMTEFVRVTTNPAYYEEHAESVELWSPGSAVFRAPEGLGESRSHPSESLGEILREAIPPRAVCK